MKYSKFAAMIVTSTAAIVPEHVRNIACMVQ